MKISKSYRRSPVPGLLTLARNVLAAMAKNPIYARLSPGVTTSEQLTDGINKCRASMEAASTHDSNRIRERNAAQAELVKLLDSLVKFLELQAVNDPNAYYDTGFELVSSSRSASSSASHPGSYRLAIQHGPKSGSVLGKATRFGPGEAQARSYEIHVAEGDPLVETNWGHKAVFARLSSMEMDGFTPGRQYSFRGRGIYPAGPGTWSPIVTLIVV